MWDETKRGYYKASCVRVCGFVCVRALLCNSPQLWMLLDSMSEPASVSWFHLCGSSKSDDGYFV